MFLPKFIHGSILLCLTTVFAVQSSLTLVRHERQVPNVGNRSPHVVAKRSTAQQPQQPQQQSQPPQQPQPGQQMQQPASNNNVAFAGSAPSGAPGAVTGTTTIRPSRLSKKQAEDPDPTVQHERILKHLRDLHNLQLQHAAHQQFEDKQVEERQRMQMRQQQEVEEMQTRQLAQMKKHIDIMQAMIDQHMKDQKTLQLAQQKERDTLRIRQQAQLREVLKEKVKNKAQQEHMQRQMEVEQLKRLQQERLRLHEKEVGLEKMRLMQQGKLPDSGPLLQQEQKQTEVSSRSDNSADKHQQMNKPPYDLIIDGSTSPQTLPLAATGTNTSTQTPLLADSGMTTHVLHHRATPTVGDRYFNAPPRFNDIKKDNPTSQLPSPAQSQPPPPPTQSPPQTSAPSSEKKDKQQMTIDGTGFLAYSGDGIKIEGTLKKMAPDGLKQSQQPGDPFKADPTRNYRIPPAESTQTLSMQQTSASKYLHEGQPTPPSGRTAKDDGGVGMMMSSNSDSANARTMSETEESELSQAALKEAGLRLDEKNEAGVLSNKKSIDDWKQTKWN